MQNSITLPVALLTAVLLLSNNTRSAAVEVATLDATLFDAIGFTFGDFSDFDPPVTTTDGVIAIDAIDLDDVNGVFGGLGADVVADFDIASSQLDVNFTVGENNAASAFRVTLLDIDGAGIADEHVYEFDISGITPGVPTNLSIPFSVGPLFTQGAFGQIAGNGLQDFGLAQIQIQSVFDSTERLNILVENVQIIDTNAIPTIVNFTAGGFGAQPNNFTFGTFSDTGAFDTSGENIIINADADSLSGPGGGAGFTGLDVDFEASEYQIEFDARLLGGNTASQFNLLLGDIDGDDSGPGLGSDDFIFTIETSEFNETDFSTVVIPLGSGSESNIVTTFGFDNGGNGLQDFDLSQVQIQADGEVGGVLNLEIASFTIVEVPPAGSGDFDEDGDVDGADFLVWQQGFGAGTFDASDLADWQAAISGGGLAAAAVPEPTSSILLVSAVALAALRRR